MCEILRRSRNQGQFYQRINDAYKTSTKHVGETNFQKLNECVIYLELAAIYMALLDSSYYAALRTRISYNINKLWNHTKSVKENVWSRGWWGQDGRHRYWNATILGALDGDKNMPWLHEQNIRLIDVVEGIQSL